MPTIAEAAAAVIEQKRHGWRNPEHVRSWRNSLRRYALPRVGTRPVSEVASADVLAILAPIWHTKPTLAKALRQRLHAVLDWAVAMNLRSDNPAGRVRPVLGPQRNIVEHMRALPHREVAAALATVRASRKKPVDKLAFEFLVLTAARSGEVRFAAWDEMDTAGRVWTLSAQRMKMKRDHRVPLCRRAVEVLDEARTLADAGPLVFPAPAGGPLDVQRLRRLLKTLRHRLRSAWLPVLVPGLGGRGDRPPARGHRGGARSPRRQPGRGRLRPLGPVRAAAPADGRLVGLPRWTAWTGPRGYPLNPSHLGERSAPRPPANLRSKCRAGV